MRKGGLYIIIILTIVVSMVGFLWSDHLLECKLEQAASSVLGTKVEIDGLKYYLRGAAISFERLRVANPANPWKNLFEIGPAGFYIEPAPLLRKKVVINKVYLSEIQLATERKSYAEIPKRAANSLNWVDKIENYLAKQIAVPPIFHNLGRKINTDSLVTHHPFQSLNYLAKIKSQVDSTYYEWEKLIRGFETGADFETNRKRAEEDFTKLLRSLHETDKWVEADLITLKDKENFFKIKPGVASTLLFGKPLVHTGIQIFKYIDLFRKVMPVPGRFVANEKEETPRRFAGQDIRFPVTDSTPNFLIKEFAVKSPPNQKEAKDRLRVRGEITGVTSNPAIFGKSMSFEISAKYPNPRRLGILGEINHTGAIPWEKFQLLGSGIELLSFDMPKRPFFPIKMITDRGKISTGFELNGNEIEILLSLTAVPATFVFPESVSDDTLIVKRIRDVLQSKERFYVGARLIGSVDDLELHIRSSVDRLLAKELISLLSDAVVWDQEKIHLTFSSLLAREKRAVLELIHSRRSQVISKIESKKITKNEKSQ
ncbi:MAG: hypothetical protein ACE5IR_13365 [bacterium]